MEYIQCMTCKRELPKHRVLLDPAFPDNYENIDCSGCVEKFMGRGFVEMARKMLEEQFSKAQQ